MSNPPFVRSKLTEILFNTLRLGLADQNVLAGRGVAPQGGGWTSGQAGVGTFVEYVVLKTGQATTPGPGQPERLARARTSWVATYQLTYHSTKESLVDPLADKGRALLVTLEGPLDLAGIDWTLQRVEIPRLGPTQADNTTDPPHWSVTDDVSLHVSRVQTR